MPKLGKLERDIDAKIGDKIRARRVRLGLSQADLAALIGMSFQQVQKYERGSNRIASSILLRVAAALKCSASYLLGSDRDLNSNQKWLADLAADKDTAKILRQFSELKSLKARRKILLALKGLLKEAGEAQPRKAPVNAPASKRSRAKATKPKQPRGRP